ncbi:hypothetical protein GCM10025794_20350 [Massilia kyonggiensis]
MRIQGPHDRPVILIFDFKDIARIDPDWTVGYFVAAGSCTEIIEMISKE